MKIFGITLVATLVLVASGCSPSPIENTASKSGASSNAEVQETEAAAEQVKPAASVVISPGPSAEKEAQEALILAESGDIIEFAEGTFKFKGTLSLDGIDDITVRGQGMEKTILNFSDFQAGKGGEGMKVKANNFILEDLTIENTPGDAIKLQDSDGLTMRRVRTWWTGGAATENGAYGLYPVLSKNVLIEHCVAEGASDAGIYVGQSKQVIVRNCRVEHNVAGIEIENCIGADVYDNVANNNTGGILVFSLPGLIIKNGSDCRIYDNEISSNNHPNFAKQGAMVATVPPGTGLMIMANDRVEAFGNKFSKNGSAGCLIVSFLVAQRKFDDAEYDPYPESINIHDNSFADGGTEVHGEFLKSYSDATKANLPDIVCDGILDVAKLVDGKMPSELSFSIKDNGEATFVNLDLGRAFSGEEPKISTDLKAFSETLEPVKAVVIPVNNERLR